MPVGEICNREIITVRRGDSAPDAARLMRQHHVGDVLVVEDRGGVRVPVGIVTDRDLVVEIMASELNQKLIAAGDFMVPELATIKENAGVFEAIQYMRARGVRRLPVVDDSGGPGWHSYPG